MQLEISRLERNEWSIISPSGEIDLATVGQLENELNANLESGPKHVVVDLTGVTFMDSTGLRALLAAHQNLAIMGRRMTLVVAGGPVDRLLDISGVGPNLEIFPSVEAAIA
jgi:anti-anti-sigma factor